MKIKLLITSLLLIAFSAVNAQESYTLELGQDSQDRYTFFVSAIPSSTLNDVTFVQGGVRVLIETGETMGDFNSIVGDNWSAVIGATGQKLLEAGLGDGTKDYYYITPDPSNDIFNQLATEVVRLTEFKVISEPKSGFIQIISDDHPIAKGVKENGLSGDNFFRVNQNTGNGDENLFGGLSGTTDYDFSKSPSLSNAIFSKSDFSLIPNPNNGKFTIASDYLTKDTTIEIYNIAGQQVFRSKQNPFGENVLRFDVSQVLAPGAYLARLQSGKAEQMLKMVIDK